MGKSAYALRGGMARQLALAVVAVGLLLFAFGIGLQASQLRAQFQQQQQQQLRQTARHSALLVRARIASAEALFRWAGERLPTQAQAERDASRLQVIQGTGVFGQVQLLSAGPDDSFSLGTRRFELSAREHEALEEGRSLLLAPRNAEEAGRLYLLREIDAAVPQRRLLAELSEDWWRSMLAAAGPVQLVVFDAHGQSHFSTRAPVPPVARQGGARLQSLHAGGSVADLAWIEAGETWSGAVTPIESSAVTSGAGLALVALAADQPWATAFWSALRAQAIFLPLLLLLAWASHAFTRRHERVLRQMRSALVLLPERRINVDAGPGIFGELRAMAETLNHATQAIQQQNDTRRIMEEIDALLLPGGDYESVIDQVLIRVRAITQAHNVGLTLVDAVTGHGRLFVVSATGGQPVTRVLLDGEMVATLRDAEQGLTIARCEEGRHSFLEPLQGGGSGFFWVWPVLDGAELAAILAVGHAQAPLGDETIAGVGTRCAQRLGLSLASNARAERLYRQAHFDPLTQLPNRLLFRDQLQAEVQAALQRGTGGALLFIDLDHFKRVNDSLGHEAGDQLLAIVAQRLRGCVKEGDTVARLGGDEFTVILGSVPDAEEVAVVARRIIDSLRKPVHLGGRDHLVRASIGIALFPEEGTGIDELLHHADLAMYRAKELGRGGAEFYNAKMNLRSPDSGMFRALGRREFSLYYQPQYHAGDGSLAGVEALLRWQQPGGALRTSAEFVPAAEESGLIVDLGGWVIEAACQQIRAWRDAGIAAPVLSVNLSVQQLRDARFVSSLCRQLERHAIPAASLMLEFSEAALTDEASQPCIGGLVATGVGLVVDHFGTGTTALANLRRHPVKAVKIDHSFVERLAEEQASAAMTRTLIMMAHGLDKSVIAEGVETAGQLECLREQGCDIVQGHFLARPLSAQDMTSLLLGRLPLTAEARRAAGA